MPGAERLRDSSALTAILAAQRDARRPYAAICASPVVCLEAKGLIGDEQRATAHPAVAGKLKNQRCGHRCLGPRLLGGAARVCDMAAPGGAVSAAPWGSAWWWTGC